MESMENRGAATSSLLPAVKKLTLNLNSALRTGIHHGV